MNIKPITWRELPGNKYSRGLHPAMLHEEKYHKRMYLPLRQGDDRTYCEVEYDKEYALRYLSKKVCEPFQILGLESLLELVKEAYEFSQQTTLMS